MSEWFKVLVLKTSVFYTIGSNPILSVLVDITQLVRVSVCGSECRGFNSHYLPFCPLFAPKGLLSVHSLGFFFFLGL